MCLELRCIWDEYVFFGDGIFMLVWDETNYIKVWFCSRGMMRCLFRWNGLKTVTCCGRMGGWTDGSMITSLNCGTSIDAITEISGVQRQFLGIRFVLTTWRRYQTYTRRASNLKFSYCFTWSLSARRYPWTSSLVRFMLNLTCVRMHHDPSCL